MAEENKALNDAGLSNWESSVYRALIKLGESKAGPIISESEVPQSKIYRILYSLQNKGLVSYIIKGKIKYFQASDPEKIYLLFKKKENAIKSEVDKLKELKKSEPKKSSVRIFEGLRAIRALNLEIIQGAKKGEEFYGYSEGTGYSKEVSEFYHQFGELRKTVGLKDHLLITKNNKAEFEKGISKEDLPYTRKKTKYYEVSFPQDTAIFRDMVIIYDWDEIPKAILIKSENLARNYKEFFLDLWNEKKK
ncbi:MAG: helix-turn-helix domain-containing protein [Candidatus Pacearchaeota archaeon]|jgi:sugar-specific transcriptional regulator TrmB